jgi:hypothetical protein
MNSVSTHQYAYRQNWTSKEQTKRQQLDYVMNSNLCNLATLPTQTSVWVSACIPPTDYLRWSKPPSSGNPSRFGTNSPLQTVENALEECAQEVQSRHGRDIDRLRPSRVQGLPLVVFDVFGRHFRRLLGSAVSWIAELISCNRAHWSQLAKSNPPKAPVSGWELDRKPISSQRCREGVIFSVLKQHSFNKYS